MFLHFLSLPANSRLLLPSLNPQFFLYFPFYPLNPSILQPFFLDSPPAMLMSRVLSRVSRTVGSRSLLFAPRQLQFPILSNHAGFFVFDSPNKLVPGEVSLLHDSAPKFSIFQRFGLSSSASPEPSENNGEPSGQGGDRKTSHEARASSSEGAEVTKESDSESDGDLTMDDMVKLMAEKDELLETKQKEIEQMKDKVVRTLAEMENVMARTRREAENSKKFAIQSFAKSLLDVADNLERASTHVKGSFSKIDESKDTAAAEPLLKTLLDGVEMTEKQLAEVFRKSGIEKFNPLNEPFDPNMHNAVFQVPDNSKPAGTVAHVLKAGYMLYDRVIRPAEVGVTQALQNDAAENNDNDNTSAKA